MKCMQCGFENRREAKFCSECGHALETACPKCGSALRGGARFCDQCGHQTAEPAPIAPLDYNQPQSYTPKHLKEKILTTRSAIEGERKLVTVLFADAADFTEISGMLDPEEVHQIMDGCFRILMDEIHRCEGSINQFTGDGVMALFGAPVAHEDHAQRACHAALAIQRALKVYGEKIYKDLGVAFRMRIGLNTGPVVVSSIGDDLRMDYTAIGDTANLASRMESMAEPGEILISRNTYRLVNHFFECTALAPVAVKGKEGLQQVYRLERTGKAVTRIEASAAKGLTRFIGRHNSFAALWEAWGKASSGSGQAASLVGEAGVGKSRILLEFKKRLDEQGITCLEGCCLHYGASMPYLPFLDILKILFGIEEDDREFIVKKKIRDKVDGLGENMAHMLSPLQALLSVAVDDPGWLGLEPQERRERAFEALRDLLILSSQDQPLVIAVEDLHWIDKTSEEFLGYFMGWIAASPILLVITYRPEYTHPWGSRSYYSQIRVDQLTSKSSTELISAMLEGGEAVPELRDLIITRAAGNPLYMEELTRSLFENGCIAKEGAQFALIGRAESLQVPDTIQGIIAARIDRLEESLKRTMQVASVIGRDFAFKILQTVTGMRENLKKSLVNLQDLEFIYEKQLFPELEYIFKHVMIQEVAYDSLLIMRRKELHEKIGQAVEEIYSARIEEFYEVLAYHYSKSENAEKACKYLKLSGEKASIKHANQESLQIYRQALEILKSQPESQKRKKAIIALIQQMLPPMVFLNYPGDSLRLIEYGEDLAKKIPDEKAMAVLNARLAHYYSWAGNTPLSMDYAEKSIRYAEASGCIDLMIRTVCGIINTYYVSGKIRNLIEISARLINIIEKQATQFNKYDLPIIPYPYLCSYASIALALQGRFSEMQTYLDKGLPVAMESNHLVTMGHSNLFYAFSLLIKGEYEKPIELAQMSLKCFEKANSPLFYIFALTALAWAYCLSGDLETARGYCDKSLKMHKDTGIVFNLNMPYYISALIHYYSGNLSMAKADAEMATKLAEGQDSLHTATVSAFMLAVLLTKMDPENLTVSEAIISEHQKRIEREQLATFHAIGNYSLGECYAHANQKSRALEKLRIADQMFHEMGGMPHFSRRIQDICQGLEPLSSGDDRPHD
ncbi:Double zinc ribbon [Desulfatibacillum alkenivorans DSM 16219]|uniref:Double zinc ribbon n=1 Tax=Desulfatibacillum alkenivorans DSM 16219 TaxID=1121393 RepID=A0A1M6WVV0_9BACT|nr:adenylate/guanylate cyclase domain-containing protein [Desulfatibacillum alkenivorans]SHK97867.1 Double zinc ribbon [Desulfatibacillum alkenivorans DSM 16219]